MTKSHELSPVENPKHTPDKLAWNKKMLAELQEEFPENNFRMDEEYFIYDLGGKEVHIPKWESIPQKEGSPKELKELIRKDIEGN
jgi:hypothetical protein